MHKFFQPVAKKQKKEPPSLTPAEPQEQKKDPLSYLSWNCNGLSARLSSKPDFDALVALVGAMKPDVIGLQEVRLPAHCDVGAKIGDGRPRSRGRLKCNDKASADDKGKVDRLLRALGDYRAYWSLADSKYAGTCLLVSASVAPPTKLLFDFTAGAGQAGQPNHITSKAGHEPEGRIILAEFESVRLLITYTPMNGWGRNASFEKRIRFERKVVSGLKQLQEEEDTLNALAPAVKEAKVGVSGAESEGASAIAPIQPRGGEKKALVWIGDLNVAHNRELDVTDSAFFAIQKETLGAGKSAQVPALHADDVGQPGFTLNEQTRFTSILQDLDLVDAYRQTHAGSGPPPRESPSFSWRGAPGNSKYSGKGMRVDYTLVDRATLAHRVVEARILGGGTECTGFLGSDHSPILLTLSSGDDEGK